MIPDHSTTFLYFSELLSTEGKYAAIWQNITKALSALDVKFGLLPHTADIWCRDYMPVQISKDKFVEYRYDPDYLQGDASGYRSLKTYPDMVCDAIGLSTVKTDLIIDGGNVVKSRNCIVMTDKVVLENRLKYSKQKLIARLHDVFEVDKVVIIPADPDNEFGHTDGMLRFINDDAVLVSSFYRGDTEMLRQLNRAGLKAEFLDLGHKKLHKLEWAYVNFLQMRDVLLLPVFENGANEKALELIQNWYPVYKGKILPVDCTSLLKHGGALNCVSWTRG
jgi:agmatine/peptidylarginine deiminase